MSKITWGNPLTSMYQAGVSRGVYFNENGEGSAWNGLISVVEGEDRQENAPMYLDGQKIVNRRRFGDFLASIEVIMGPDELKPLLRAVFDFAYRVEYSNHYEIHLVYNASAVVDNRTFQTVADRPELTLAPLKVSTLPTAVDQNKRTSHLVISSLITRADALAAFEAAIYGDADHDSRLPTPDEVLEIFESHAILRVTYLGEGAYEISGPDDVCFENLGGSWTIDWASVIQVHESVYQISSL